MKIIIAAATLSMVALLAQAKQDLPKVDEQGLHLISNPVFSIVYADPEADLKTYKRVKLLDTYVAFRKNWQKNYNSSSTIRVYPLVKSPGPGERHRCRGKRLHSEKQFRAEQSS